MQEVVFLTGLELLDVGFRGVKENPAEKAFRPEHLHFDDEMATVGINAPHVDIAVFFDGNLRDEFGAEALQKNDSALRAEREHGIKEAREQVGMLAEDFLECQIVFWSR